MTTAIKIENLSKAYQIGQFGTGTISRDIERWFITKVLKKDDPFLSLGETNDRTKRSETNIVWSLKDISFDIEQGDAIGIIGRNGAGKSTLLKLLSRVTAPTTGSIKIKGRVASLLEVGTGFHPELTGRENIYLNGSILGMRKREIDRKLDEIVDFSGVERYIDTPVKRYSSGMSVRLAFAVAAHLESEILIVDEVLAVGDAEFQKKCLGKMEEVGKREGRTVLFVSHNMSAVHALCSKGVLLESGEMAFKGSVSECVNKYALRNIEPTAFDQLSAQERSTSRIFGIKVNDASKTALRADDAFDVSVTMQCSKLHEPAIIFMIHNASGQQIVHSRILSKQLGMKEVDGIFRLQLSVPPLWLTPGLYSIFFKMISLHNAPMVRTESERFMLEVKDDFDAGNRGIIHPRIEWDIEPVRTANGSGAGNRSHKRMANGFSASRTAGLSDGVKAD